MSILRAVCHNINIIEVSNIYLILDIYLCLLLGIMIESSYKER